jgi:acyl-CoA thioesterase YciA
LRRFVDPHAGDAADTNQNGDIWRLAAQSDGYRWRNLRVQGSEIAYRHGRGRGDEFSQTVFVGDVVSVHANLVRIGKTSITVHIEAWVKRRKEMQSILVTDGNFTYVSIDEQGHPQAIKRDGAPVSA